MSVQGGLFDGGWESGMADLVVDLTGAVADTALGTWKDNLDRSIRVNHGRYTSLPHVDRVSDDTATVNDGGSVYGPWLEGTGSRNSPVTRFKGYGSARDAAMRVNATAVEIGADVTARFVGGMNA